jgi:PAS domain S-box-containing protein
VPDRATAPPTPRPPDGDAGARSTTLELEPVAQSVGVARRALTELLRDVDRPEWTECAQLAVSEVVTNAVLHAHTAVQLSATLTDTELRVEVRDRNPTLPAHGPTDDGATTGRGMGLVAAMVSECGVTPLGPDGKVVWFVLRDDAADDIGALTAEELLDQWDLEAFQSSAAPEPPSDETLGTVVLRGLPPRLWLAAREHHQGILREFYLYDAIAGGGSAEAFAQTDTARQLVFSTLMEALRAAGVDAANHPHHADPARDAPARLDLELPVPPGGQQAFQAMQDILDAAERLAVAGRLLARPALPEILALRDWVCDQVVAQCSGGVAPSPWPGVAQERFTVEVHDRRVQAGPAWDPSSVATSDRAVVAADDANRILAVSRPLAAAIGWDVDDLVGRRVVTLVPPRLREAHIAGFSRHLTTGESHLLGVPTRLPVLHADGTEAEYEVLLEQAVAERGHAVFLAWVTPVTD